ncbi:MAG: hypothetical protein IKS85_03950 [Lachnospiraceae bacterium]|nr:hypothetical protein [Lachnospiraceae bacterium]
MESERLIDGNERDGRGFHWLYLWGLFYVIMTYAYPVIAFMSIPKVDESVTSSAAYKEAAKAQNGILGADLPFFVLVIPVALLIISIIIAVRSKSTHRRVLLNTAQIIKYLLIPFYIAGGLLIVIFILLMFTPVVIMIFISPVVIGILSVLGWISLAGSAPLMIAYLSKSVEDGRNIKSFALAAGICQFFFAADVISTIICAIKEKKS